MNESQQGHKQEILKDTECLDLHMRSQIRHRIVCVAGIYFRKETIFVLHPMLRSGVGFTHSDPVPRQSALPLLPIAISSLNGNRKR